MKKLTQARAQELKKQGVTHIISTMTTCFNTRYVKYATLDTILNNGGFIPHWDSGVTYNSLPDEIKNHSIFWNEI